MKFIISSWLFLMAAEVSASPIKIFYEQDPTRATWVKEIFTQTYSIPEDLIALKEVVSCEELKERGKLDLCLNNNGDLLVVSVDRGFVTESLQIFQAP
jgi:DNA/RNA endonuclease YhcR with UshA esterase domain